MIKRISLFGLLLISLQGIAQNDKPPKLALEAYRQELEKEIAQYQKKRNELKVICSDTSIHTESCRLVHSEIKRIDSILAVRYNQYGRIKHSRNEGCYGPVKVKRVYSSDESELGLQLLEKKGNLKWPLDSSCFSISTVKKLAFNHTVKSIVMNDTCTMFMRCVSNGKVTSSGEIPGAGKFVIVRHGEYLSVYSGFDKLLVKNGDVVKEGQPLGQWIKGFDYNDVTFQVWRKTGKEKLEEWLAPGQPNH